MNRRALFTRLMTIAAAVAVAPALEVEANGVHSIMDTANDQQMQGAAVTFADGPLMDDDRGYFLEIRNTSVGRHFGMFFRDDMTYIRPHGCQEPLD